MSVHFICGRPGNGKGLVAMDVIIKELVSSDRCIITNLPVFVEPWCRNIRRFGGQREHRPEKGLRHYLLEKYGKDFEVRKRLHVLSDDATGEFYLRRVVGGEVLEVNAERDDKGRVVSFDTSVALREGGMLYVTDEAWKFFGARDWQQTGKGVQFYGAQHRHLGDDWFIVCQHTKQVDTAFRMIAQDYWVVVNHSKRKLGFLRQPDIFSVSEFASPPEAKAEPPMSRRVFRIDKKGVGGCYDTAGGTGVSGSGGADILEKKRGLNFLWIFAFLLLGGAGVVIAANGSGWFAGMLLTGGFNKPKTHQQKPSVAVRGSDQVVRRDEVRVRGLARSPLAVSVVTNTPVWWRGTVYLGSNRWVVCLSDGRILRTDAGEVGKLGVGWVIDSGGRFYASEK